MSRQNKVNPGMYTQRGRLTQDDFARELKQQREAGSAQPWPPEQQHEPFHFRETPKADDAADGEQDREPAKPVQKQPARVRAKTAKKPARTAAAKPAVKAKKATTVKRKSAKRAKPATRAKAAPRATSATRAKAAKRAKPSSRAKAKARAK